MAFKKYPKVKRPGDSSVEHLFTDDDQPLFITEKFDGNNFRATRDGDQLRFGSRNVDLGTDVDEIGGMFDDVSNYLDEVLDVDRLEQLEELRTETRSSTVDSIVLFGENAVQHTIDEYDWDLVPQFQLFDVFIKYENRAGEWLPWDITKEAKDLILEENDILDGAPIPFFTVWDVAEYLGLHTVPEIERTTVGEFDLQAFEVPASTFRPDEGPAEGVVFRNPVMQEKAKFISEMFAERHQSAKQGDLEGSDRDDDVYTFVANHATERRIEKNIAKLIEEPGNGYDELQMEMMEDLHEQLWHDIWDEDYEIIIDTGWTLDLKRAHNEVASKAASHLRQLLQAGETPVTVVDPSRGETVEPPRGDA